MTGLLATVLMLSALSGCSGGQSALQKALEAERSSGINSVKAKATIGDVEVVARERAPMEPFDSYAYHHFENALLLEALGQDSAAAESYRRVLTYYPNSHEAGLYYAENLMRMGRPQKALEALHKIRPQSEAVLYLKAGCYRSVQDMDAAKEAYVKLVGVNPRHTTALAFLANYFHRSNNVDSTIWAYRLLVKAGENDPRMLNELGRMLQQTGRTDEAREVLWQAVRATTIPYSLSVAALGELYDAGGQPDSAEIVFKFGLESAPDNILLHRELARLYFIQDSSLKALPHVRSVAELSPSDVEASRRLGILYFGVDSLQQADSVLTMLVNSGDIDVRNHFYLGRVAVLQGDFERARDEFTRQSELAETEVESWLDLGFAYRKLDDAESESATYRKGLERMTDESSAIKLLFALGSTMERIGQIDSSVTVFEEILKHDPDDHQALNYLGYTLADNDLRLDYAYQLIARANELEPNNPAYLDSFGWVQFKRGEISDAVEHLRRAATLDNDPVILDHLGDALYAAGQQQEAREWWRRALELQPDNEHLKEKLDR